MSIKKTMMVGRPRIPVGQKKITWSFSIDQQLLTLIKAKVKHGKAAAWARKILWEAVKNG